ncbi:MAG TPA: response regulator transcription factor [Candidatus Sulfotelmatobacter sp.]|jgi:two-component system response regulator NreC|nr:response regulator transcription factor [Candidatus Sulfotelmatobacter sp.]
MKVTRILVADDHETSRLLIRTLLSKNPEWKVYAEAADGEEAVELAKKSCPDLAILDIQMPRKNGIEAAKEILRECPSTIILSDSLHDVNFFAETLQEVGVKGFVFKPRMDRDLIPTVEAVLKGQTCFPPSVSSAY